MLAATFISIFMVPATFAVVEKVSHYFSPEGESDSSNENIT